MDSEDDLSKARRERAYRLEHPYRSGSYFTAVRILRANEDGCPLGLDDADNLLKLEYNDFLGRVEIGRKAYADADTHRIRATIESEIVVHTDEGKKKPLQLSVADIHNAAEQVALENRYHPIRSYLSSLVWDKVKRCESLAEDVLGAESTTANQAIMKRFLVSAVARVMNPGCKVDTVLVLVGKQGAKKSTFFAELAKGWFLDSAIDIHSKDAYEQLRRGWIIEWSELEALRRSRDASAIKAFVTSQVDVYRPAYGRVAKEHPRQCVFVGTTNDQEFLSDPTGNRRWWPLAVKDSIDIKTLRAIRDQIWAEAVELYLANEQHWLTDEEEAAIQPERQRHMVSDLWEKTVIGYAAKEPKVYVRDVLIEGLEMEEKDITKIDQMRVADILKNHGFLRHRSNGQTFWTPQGQTKSS